MSVQSTDDNILQNDLHALEKWEQDWSMEFISDKCEVLRITRKRNPVSTIVFKLPLLLLFYY